MINVWPKMFCISYFLFMVVYRVIEWYIVKEIISIIDNFKKLYSFQAFLFSIFLPIESEKD